MGLYPNHRVFSKRRQVRANIVKLLITVALVFSSITASTSSIAQDSKKTWSPDIPKTWDDNAMLSLQIPLAHPAVSPKFISSDYYYKMPVRPVYRSYPIYHPDKEPV